MKSTGGKNGGGNGSSKSSGGPNSKGSSKSATTSKSDVSKPGMCKAEPAKASNTNKCEAQTAAGKLASGKPIEVAAGGMCKGSSSPSGHPSASGGKSEFGLGSENCRIGESKAGFDAFGISIGFKREVDVCETPGVPNSSHSRVCDTAKIGVAGIAVTSRACVEVHANGKVETQNSGCVERFAEVSAYGAGTQARAAFCAVSGTKGAGVQVEASAGGQGWGSGANAKLVAGLTTSGTSYKVQGDICIGPSAGNGPDTGGKVGIKYHDCNRTAFGESNNHGTPTKGSVDGPPLASNGAFGIPNDGCHIDGAVCLVG